MRVLGVLALVAGCGDDGVATGGPPIAFGTMGSLSAPAGKGGFRFGAASAATQIEDWDNKLDWLGVQYYFRAGVTGKAPLLPAPIAVTPCTSGVDGGACLPALQPSYCVPAMGYEGWVDGLHDVLGAFAQRYPDLPLVVTEHGVATEQRAKYGGTGPMTREPDHNLDSMCRKAPR